MTCHESVWNMFESALPIFQIFPLRKQKLNSIRRTRAMPSLVFIQVYPPFINLRGPPRGHVHFSRNHVPRVNAPRGALPARPGTACASCMMVHFHKELARNFHVRPFLPHIFHFRVFQISEKCAAGGLAIAGAFTPRSRIDSCVIVACKAQQI